MSILQSDEIKEPEVVQAAIVMQTKGKWVFEEELSSLIISHRKGDLKKEIFYSKSRV